MTRDLDSMRRPRCTQRSATILPALVLAVATIGCGTGEVLLTPPPPPPGPALTGPGPFLVSNATPRIGAALLDSADGGNPGLVWVSLRPGALPDATGVALLVRRTGVTISAELLDGGLDPVAIEAVAGDTVVLTVTGSAAPTPPALVFTVPERKPPVIVRTVPPRGTRDVALNTRMQVVFSEPVASSVLTSGAITLRSDDGAVPGQLRFADAAHTVVEFIPDHLLADGTAYEFVIGPGIEDLDGEPLASPTTIEFATSPLPGGPPLPPTAEVFAFTRGADIWISSPAGQRRLTEGHAGWDQYPSWSPDGNRIAFIRDFGWPAGIVVMNADGTEQQILGYADAGSRPVWTADGQSIVFLLTWFGQLELRSLPAPGSADEPRSLLTLDVGVNAAALSPDGRMLAFTVRDSLAPWVSAPALYVIPLDRSAPPRRLAQGPASSPFTNPAWQLFTDLSWSADGQQVAFAECSADPSGWLPCYLQTRLSVVGVDGSGYRGIAMTNGFAAPTWSRDGTGLAFADLACEGVLGAHCVRIVQQAGGSDTVVLLDGLSPAWRK